MEQSSDTEFKEQLFVYIKNLEKRISTLEAKLDIFPSTETDSSFHLPSFISHKTDQETEELEAEIGQFWFAKVGIALLAIGFLFVLTFPFPGIPQFIPGSVGLVFGGILFSISNYLKKSFELLSRYFSGTAFCLLFFSVLRFYYFTDAPVLSHFLLTLMLTAVSLFIIYSAKKKGSIYIYLLGILALSITVLIGNNIYLAIISFLLLSALIVYVRKQFPSSLLINAGILIILIAHFWISSGNRFFAGENSTVITSIVPPAAIILFSVVLLAGIFFSNGMYQETIPIVAGTVFNSLIPLIFLLLLSVLKFKDQVTILHFFTFIIYMASAVYWWIKYKSKYVTFIFSMVSYAALSVSIVSYFARPDSYVWLCWQSFLVVSTAIWFRSKIIIVANFFLYLFIYLAYLVLAGNPGIISLSFGFVALLSARVLNWQKQRLELRTEIMRIAYLVAAFIIFPYALFHIVPANYLGLSWMLLSLFYFILGNIFKNNKYRWMSISTLLVTVIYVMTFGAATTDLLFRILSFIILGILLLVTSIFYAGKKRKQVS